LNVVSLGNGRAKKVENHPPFPKIKKTGRARACLFYFKMNCLYVDFERKHYTYIYISEVVK
jgi:hypothetical protein